MPTLQTLHENEGLYQKGNKCTTQSFVDIKNKLVFSFFPYCSRCSLSSLPYQNYSGPKLPFVSLLRYKFRKGRAITENAHAFLLMLFFLYIYQQGNIKIIFGRYHYTNSLSTKVLFEAEFFLM